MSRVNASPEAHEVRRARAQVANAAVALRRAPWGTGERRRASDHLRDSQRRLLRALVREALPPDRRSEAFAGRLSGFVAEYDDPDLAAALIDHLTPKERT